VPVSLPLTLVIGKLPASISITGVSPNPAKLGQLISVTVQTASASGSPTGSVLLTEGQVTAGAGVLSNGQATMTLSGLSAGAQHCGDYAGDVPGDRGRIVKRLRTVLSDPSQGPAIRRDLLRGLRTLPTWMQDLIRNMDPQVRRGGEVPRRHARRA
jgi:hypothetical protein